MTDLLSSNLSAVCEDETAFGKLFSLPPESNLTMRDLQDTVCGVNLNITKLVSELEKSVPGFKDMLDAVSMLMIHTVKFLNFGTQETAIIHLKFKKEAKHEGILSKTRKWNSKQ